MANKGCGSYTKIQNYTSVSLKLCLLGKNNRDMGCEYHFNITLIILLYMVGLSKFNLYSA